MSIFTSRKKTPAPRPKFVFDAYEHVTPGQYHLYAEYADLFIGSEQSVNIARKILVLAYVENDETVIGFNAEIRELRKKFTAIPTTYDIFAIRSKQGNTFDIYCLDAQGNRISTASNIYLDHFSWSANYFVQRVMEESSKS